jgi:hypothetical protein
LVDSTHRDVGAYGGELDVDDVAQRILGVVGDADAHAPTVDAHPFVLG